MRPLFPNLRLYAEDNLQRNPHVFQRLLDFETGLLQRLAHVDRPAIEEVLEMLVRPFKDAEGVPLAVVTLHDLLRAQTAIGERQG